MDIREWPWRLITAVIRSVAWMTFVAFAMLVVLAWMTSRNSNAITQINATTMSMTYLVAAYTVARAVDAVTRW